MSDVAIRVEGLSKQYRIGGPQARYKTLRESLVSAVRAPVQRAGRLLRGEAATDHQETIWALKDVSFEVKHGEVLGIIGRNGAGKSTLLKVLSRITAPTEGMVDLYGRVGSLLEVGTGFHPELTGRENIYLNGAILGMKRNEIGRKFDEIVAFSEIEKFLDTPVKHYSSGMYVRLAFAVAAHLDPEILLVDEVLAVGDAAFQKKCLGKMGEVAGEGRTVLFVSHNMAAVQKLSGCVVWLDDGHIRESGSPAQTVASYLDAFSQNAALTNQVWKDIDSAPGNQVVRLRRVSVRPENGSSSDPITMETPLVLEFEFWNLVPGSRLMLNFRLITEQQLVAFENNSTDPQWWDRAFPVGLFRSACHIPGGLLNSGIHEVMLRVGKDRRAIFEYERALRFEVQESQWLLRQRAGYYGKTLGVVHPVLEWTTELVASGIATEALDQRGSI